MSSTSKMWHGSMWNSSGQQEKRHILKCAITVHRLNHSERTMGPHAQWICNHQIFFPMGTKLEKMPPAMTHATRMNRKPTYSGTSVYVRFGISPTWYMSCLDVKNFVWYTTIVWNTTCVHQNQSRHKAQTSRNSIVWNDQTMSHFRNILRRWQKQSSLDRFLVNAKPGDPQPGPSREKEKRKLKFVKFSFISSNCFCIYVF
jgi:hypothetical protein